MDTLPENQGWTINKTGNVTTSVSSGILTIENNVGFLTYTAPADWRNTVNNTKGWIVEFRLKLEHSNISSQNVLITITINDNFIYSGITLYENKITLLGDLAFQYFMNTTDEFHVYKFIGQGSMLRVFVDEKLVIVGPSPSGSPPPATITIASRPLPIKSYWDYISYDTNPNIKLTSPTLTVIDGTSSYYISNLTGATLDNSFIVIPNGTYAGWCIDKSAYMVRNEAHNVTLYSSINSSSAPRIRNTTNYILNHKQGSMKEIQEAIWYFNPDGDVSPPINETNTWNMIRAARANPNYVPGKGDIMAIIAYAGHGSSQYGSGYGVQNTILEYRIP